MTDRILCTGGLGFIGSHFVEHLLATTTDDVVVLDRIDAAGNQSRLPEWAIKEGRLRVVWHDLKAPINQSVGKQLGNDFRYVVHMAAGSHVDRSIKEPALFVLDNVLGTCHLLDWLRDSTTVGKILYFGTDEIFGPAKPGQKFKDHARIRSNNPYSATKAGGEVLCDAYVHQYGMPIVVTHSTNVYGPRQDPEKFIPLVVGKLRRDETVQIHCDEHGNVSTRYYLWVEDVCRAVMTVLRKGGILSGRATGKYNISGALEVSNLDLAQMIASLMGATLRYELVTSPAGRPKPDMRYGLDCTRLKALGWRPLVSLEQGLEETVKSYVG
jgi:dTDP-glucose 4,6-dehydratase